MPKETNEEIEKRLKAGKEARARASVENQSQKKDPKAPAQKWAQKGGKWEKDSSLVSNKVEKPPVLPNKSRVVGRVSAVQANSPLVMAQVIGIESPKNKDIPKGVVISVTPPINAPKVSATKIADLANLLAKKNPDSKAILKHLNSGGFDKQELKTGIKDKDGKNISIIELAVKSKVSQNVIDNILKQADKDTFTPE
jgi:hypothetical protein